MINKPFLLFIFIPLFLFLLWALFESIYQYNYFKLSLKEGKDEKELCE